jgi:hypothetical protein
MGRIAPNAAETPNKDTPNGKPTTEPLAARSLLLECFLLFSSHLIFFYYVEVRMESCMREAI